MKTALYTIAAAFVLTFSQAYSQEEVGVQSFGGSFTIHYNEDDTRNYYAVDLNHFADENVRKSFIKKVYYDSQLAALNSPGASGVWCLTAHKAFSKEAILQKLVEYKNELTVAGTIPANDNLAKND